jgi:hypothetical protein
MILGEQTPGGITLVMNKLSMKFTGILWDTLAIASVDQASYIEKEQSSGSTI